MLHTPQGAWRTSPGGAAMVRAFFHSSARATSARARASGGIPMRTLTSPAPSPKPQLSTQQQPAARALMRRAGLAPLPSAARHERGLFLSASSPLRPFVAAAAGGGKKGKAAGGGAGDKKKDDGASSSIAALP